MARDLDHGVGHPLRAGGMAMRQRDDPDADLAAYAEELVSLFDLGIRR